MLQQMEEEKKLNKKIYQLEQESRQQQERLKLTLEGDVYDQSMGKRRADIEGQWGYKKIRAQGQQGREAYDSPTNNYFENGVPGWNVYGDETGTIGLKNKRRQVAKPGKTKAKERARAKGKENKMVKTKERKSSPHHRAATTP